MLEFLTLFSVMDLIALGWFVIAFTGFAIVVEQTPLKKRSLSQAMDDHRRHWIDTLVKRELRIVDTSIVASLQNGTAFFGSTSLLAIGGCFALLNATEQAVSILNELPFPVDTTPALWDTKVLGLMALYAYAFLKFGWAYRLFAYVAILVGAIPVTAEKDSERLEKAKQAAGDMMIIAGKHFNRGQRGFFIAVGYLGWFANAEVFIVTTTIILWVLIRRQFLSNASKAAWNGLRY